MQKDIYNNVKTEIGLKLQTISSDTVTVGEIIDTQGYESGKVSVIAGTITAGTVVLTEIQESDASDMAGETAIPAARLLGTIATLDTSDTTNEIGFVTTKRYIRATVTTAGTANLVAGATVELGNAHDASIR